MLLVQISKEVPNSSVSESVGNVKSDLVHTAQSLQAFRGSMIIKTKSVNFKIRSITLKLAEVGDTFKS